MTNTDDCKNHKCQFGTCADGISNYTCKCKDGFSGNFCEIMNPIALPLKVGIQNQKQLVQQQRKEKDTIGCTINDCANGGLCFRVSLNGQIGPKNFCKCKLGYSGDKCEILKSVNFQYEDSYLEFESPDLESKLNLTFSLITEAENGILFYHGSKSRKHFSAELLKGRIRLSFDIGNQAAGISIYSYAKINDKKEHFIQIIIQGQNVSLKCINNNEQRVVSSQDGSFKYLNVGDEPIYVGGVPNSIKDRISKQLSHVKNSSSLHGCLTSFFINSELRNLEKVEYSHKISPGCLFKEPCQEDSSSKCQNGGVCEPMFSLNSDYTCKCSSDFTGRSCETLVKTNSLQYRALPLVNNYNHDRYLSSNQVLKKNVNEQDCTEAIVNEIYTDKNTGCKTKRKIKMLKCSGDCSSKASEMKRFKSLDSKEPVSYLIGTNRQPMQRSLSETSHLENEKCCVPSKTRNRRVKLFCNDGSTYLNDINIIKKCSCSKKCDLLNDKLNNFN